jgi:hypothetical protein
MKYFRINNASDRKAIGFYPQVSEGIYPTTRDSSNALGMLLYNEKATSNTEIPKGMLHKRAKLTDFLSVSFLSGSLFLSERLKNIITKYSSQGVQFLNTSIVVREKEDTSFYILYPHQSDYSFLDIEKTEFVFKDIMLKEILNKVEFKSVNEYLLALNENKKDAIRIGFPSFKPLIINKIAIIENCDIDFFSIERVQGGIGYFVSEKLKVQIEEADCTGIVFTQLNEKYP